MKGKYIEKCNAIKLREDGWSIKSIAKKLNVSQGSVSAWVRHLKIDEQQKMDLKNRNKDVMVMARKKGVAVLKEKYQKIRERYRDAGKKVATHHSLHVPNSTHMKACLLYWAEGGKSKNGFYFTNSDPTMIKMIIDFLKSEDVMVKENEISMSLNCYDDMHRIEDIEKYWENVVGFKIAKKKHIVKKSTWCPDAGRHNKYPFGVCRICVHKTEVIQHVYGALEVYAGIVIDPHR